MKNRTVTPITNSHIDMRGVERGNISSKHQSKLSSRVLKELRLALKYKEQ